MKYRQTIFRDEIFSHAKTIHRALLRLATLLSLLLTCLPVHAATDYSFSLFGQLPTGCSRDFFSTTSYSCAVITLAVGDTITVGSNKPITITLTGAFITAKNNQINATGAASDLNLITNGVLTLGAGTILNANVTGKAAINMGAYSTINGNITANTTTGVVTLAKNSTVGGFIHTDAGAVTIGDLSTIAGGITTQAGAVTVGSSSSIGKGITTQAGVVTLLTNIKVGGDISTIAGAITIGNGSSTCGSVISTGAGIVTITTNIHIGGDISTVAGAITIGGGSKVGGDISPSGAGVVTLTGVHVGGKVATGAGAITLTDSRVRGSVASSGAGVVTITNSQTNDTTLAVPVSPSCLVTPLLEYRFDQCSYTGVASDVIDQTGNFNGSSNGIPDPTDYAVINKSLDLSADNTDDWIDVPNSVVNGLNNFSISVWFKTSVSKKQQEIFHALGESTGKDELEIFLRNSNTVYIKVKNKRQELASNITLTDGSWHHLVLTRVDENVCLFADGAKQECLNAVNAGVLSVNNANAIVIGQEQGSFGGGFSKNQNFEGQLDEFKIFDITLSNTNVASIYRNEARGNNFDGSLRDTVQCKISCDSIAGQLNAVGIKIGGGSGFNSQINTTTEALNIYAAWLAAGSNFSDSINSGGNSYNVTASGSSTVDRIDFGGSTHDFSETLPYPGVSDGVSGSDFLVHTSGTLSLPAGDYTIFVEADDGFSFIMDTLSGDTVSFNKFGSSSAGASNELRFENPTANSNTGGSFTLSQSSLFDIAAIFFERGGGDYLEISIANNIRSNAAPSGYEILKHDALGGKVKFGQCSVTPQIDHYEIIHDSQGLTCDAESITVKACSNADCTTPYTESVDVQLSVNGIINKTITVLNGTSDTTFIHTLANTATLSLDETYICKVNDTPSNCDVLFADTGFRFFSGVEGTPIPTQLSGKPSNLGFNASTLKLQAIEKNAETGACQAALIDSVNIEMAATCINPSTCAGQKVIINNAIDNISVDTLNSTAALTYTTVPLDLSNNTANSAPFILTYPEAGSMQLHARYNIPDELGNSTGNYMLGSSSPFVVRPFGFSIAVEDTNNIQNPAAVDHNGAVFMSAGDIFTTTVKAVQWKTGQDSNNDGIPDDTDNIASNLITANFGNEITRETAEITHALYLPKPAILGALSNNSFNFNDGIASNSNMTYSEVGIINFTANLDDNTYLTANDISGKAPYVGRFIPENFALSVNKEGSFVSVCEGIDIDMPFAYSGQMSIINPSKGVLRYLEQPEILITPKSKLGNHTKNYTGNFNKLTLSGISRFMIDDGAGTLVLAPISDTTQLGADETKKVRLTSNFDEGILTEGENENVGILSFQYNDLDNFFYLHEENSEIPPFTSDINLAIASIIDSDTVTAIDADGAIDTDGDGIINAANDTMITLNPSGKEIRFGRAYLANSFGPETSDLPQTLFVQYLDASNHYKNTVDDTCTAFDSSKIILSTIDFDKSKTGVNTISGQFFNGETNEIELLAPSDGSDGVRGDLGVEYDIYPWLEYHWDWGGTGPKLYDQNPSAIATFGLFRGNDRIIYMREVSN